jgi:hypothetical protein
LGCDVAFAMANVISRDSEGTSGLPPCRRCVEQHIECVLAKSRRGGRRIKGVRTSGIYARQPDAANNTPNNFAAEGAGESIPMQTDSSTGAD